MLMRSSILLDIPPVKTAEMGKYIKKLNKMKKFKKQRKIKESLSEEVSRSVKSVKSINQISCCTGTLSLSTYHSSTVHKDTELCFHTQCYHSCLPSPGSQLSPAAEMNTPWSLVERAFQHSAHPGCMLQYDS